MSTAQMVVPTDTLHMFNAKGVSALDSKTTQTGNTIVTVHSSLANKSKPEILKILKDEWEKKNPVLMNIASVLANSN